MQGPNPFLLWVQDPKELIGRKNETNLYKSILKEIAARRKISILIKGNPGMGKSLLLMRYAQLAEKEGFFAPLIRAGRENHNSIVAKLKSQMKNYLMEKAAIGSITERAISKLEFGDDFIVEVAKTSQRYGEGLIVLIDDFDLLKEPEKLISMIKSVNNKGKTLRIGWVLSSKTYYEGIDVKIDLLPFDEHDVREMVEKALKKGPPKMGEGCLSTIFEESEGNPQVARSTCYVIYEKLSEKEKIISRKHYIMNKSAIMSLLSRELFDGLYEPLPESEKKVLLAFAKAGGRAHISDIAREISMRHATTLALRLVERGQVVRIDRGIYKVFTKLYGKYVQQRS
jgi:hypothetical protein